jgi:hypothetical protein
LPVPAPSNSATGGSLDGWPVPHERLTVPTREGDTFVVAWGPPDGPPVLALQGSGANAAMWLRQAPTWPGHLRVYAVDVIRRARPERAVPATLGGGAVRGVARRRQARARVGPRGAGRRLAGRLAGPRLRDPPARPGHPAGAAQPGGVGRRKVGVLLAAVLLLPFGRWGRRRMLRLALGLRGAPGAPEANWRISRS